MPFDTSPFPYRGNKPSDGQPFMDKVENGRRRHTCRAAYIAGRRGVRQPEHPALHPQGLCPSPRALIGVLHNGTELMRDTTASAMPQQLAASGLDAVLVAPQFALDAAD